MATNKDFYEDNQQNYVDPIDNSDDLNQDFLDEEKREDFKKVPTTVNYIRPGDVIEFSYNSKTREIIVIATDWKGNVDGYELEQSDSDPETVDELSQVIDYITQQRAIRIPIDEGELWRVFGDQFTFKSYKRENMIRIMRYTFLDRKEIKERKQQKQKQEKEVNVNESNSRTNRQRNQQTNVRRTPPVQNPK